MTIVGIKDGAFTVTDHIVEKRPEYGSGNTVTLLY